MTVTSCACKHMTSRSFLTLVLPSRWLIFRNCFNAVKIAIKQQQYCNTVRPQLNSDRFIHHMTSQTWRLKILFLNDSFVFNTRYEHFYNLKRLYSGYLSQILWYKRNIFFVANVKVPGWALKRDEKVPDFVFTRHHQGDQGFCFHRSRTM